MIKTHLGRYIPRCVPPWLWMGVIFWLSSQPTLPSAPEAWQDLLLKKGAHMIVYGVLAILWYRCYPGNTGSKSWMYTAWGLTVLYAFTDEYHQSFVPGRHATLRDVGVDAIGAALALYLRWRLNSPGRPPAQSQ